MRITAGVLMIVGGLGAMIGASMAVGVMFVFGGLSISLIAILTVLALAVMVMSFVGAYCAFRRRHFVLAIVGAGCATMAVPFLPGILAIVFLVLTEGEFHERGAKETVW